MENKQRYFWGALLLIAYSFVMFSCSKDDKDHDNNLPGAASSLVGYWICQKETNEYYMCSMITFTKDGYYQVREQYNNEYDGHYGTFKFDEKTNVIIFTPTGTSGGDLEDADLEIFRCQVLSLTEKTLKLRTEEGETMTYAKTSDGNFPYYVWEKLNDDDDASKYDIVGIWETVYTWSYSGIKETITMQVNRDGTLSFIDSSTNGEDPSVGGGTWEYNKNEHTWQMLTSYSLVSGTYRLVDSKLICYQYFSDGSSRIITYNRK